MKLYNSFTLCACLLIFCTAFSIAQITNITSIDSVAVFEAIPSDLAFDLLGIPGNTIQQPGTMSKLLASIQPVIDSRGTLSPGLAVSFAPYQLIKGDQLQLKDYAADPWTRLASNVQISLGTAPSINSDSSQDWGVGFKINIFNSGDGRLDTNHINQLVQSSLEIFNAIPLPSEGTVSPSFLLLSAKARKLSVTTNNAILDNDTVKANKSLDSLLEIAAEFDSLGQTGQQTYSALNQFIQKNRGKISDIAKLREIKHAIVEHSGDQSAWNSTSLDLCAGTVYRATQSKIKQSDIDRLRVWLNGGIGFGSSQLIAQIGYFQQYKNSTLNDSSYATAAIMYRYGSKDVRVGLGANGYDFDRGTMNLVTEIRLNKSAWLVISVNRDFAKGELPTWNPGFTIKTTGAGLGL
jgi:hypothetical protein